MPMRALLLAFLLVLGVPAAAMSRPLSLTCTSDLVCFERGGCSTASDLRHDFRFTGTHAAATIRQPRLSGPSFDLRLTDLDKGRGIFSSFAGFDPTGGSLLFSLYSDGFILSQHAVFSGPPDANGATATGSPGSVTFYGQCSDTPQGDE